MINKNEHKNYHGINKMNKIVQHNLIDAHKWRVEESVVNAFRVDAPGHELEKSLQIFHEALHSKKKVFYEELLCLLP
jgi:hypothetical protein